MSRNPQDVRRAAMQELARRELARRQQKPFVGPVATGQEMADSRAMSAPKATSRTEEVMRKLGLVSSGLGLGEAALSVGTGMVAAPINSLWNAAMEAGELPTGNPVPTYTPRSPQGRQVVEGLGTAMAPIANRIEEWTGLNDPNPGVRATGNLMNAAAGVVPGIGPLRNARARRVAIPTRPEIKAASTAAYARAEGAGGMLPQNNLGGFVQKAEQILADEGVDKTLHPMTMAGLNRLMEDATKPGVAGHSVKGAEVLRRVLSNAETAAYKASNDSDAALAGRLLDEFDDFMDGAMPASSAEYRTARALWNTQRKAQDIETLFERAQNRAGQYSISGMENALTTEFRALAQNQRRMRRFTPEEQDAIRQVARGSLTQKTLRGLGKFFPNGTLPLIAAATAENILPGSGWALAATGAAGRAGASALRTRSARRVDELVRSGAIPVMGPSRIPGSEPIPRLGYLPAAALGTGEARNALYRDEEPRRNALRR